MSWQAVNLGAAEFARPSEPPITLGLIYRGKRHAWSGPPEAAKTLAALIAGIEHMRAGNGRFAFVDFEQDEYSVRLMLAELGATLEEIESVYYVAPDGPPDTADIDAIEAAGVTLVIIDAAAGAYAVSELDDNKRADAETFGRAWVRPLFDRGIASLLIDHVTKNADNRGKFSIGSERKLGAVDVHLGLHAVKQLHRGANGLVVFTTHKDRPGHLSRPQAAELELHSDPATHAITWTFRPATGSTEGATDDWRPTVLMERVSNYLETQPEPVSRGTIERNVTGKAIYVRKAIDALVADGFVLEAGRSTSSPTSSRLYSLNKPFRPFVPTSSRSVPDTGRPPSSLRPTPSRGDEDGDEADRLENLGRERGLS